jgi:hypothetical protein
MLVDKALLSSEMLYIPHILYCYCLLSNVQWRRKLRLASFCSETPVSSTQYGWREWTSPQYIIVVHDGKKQVRYRYFYCIITEQSSTVSCGYRSLPYAAKRETLIIFFTVLLLPGFLSRVDTNVQSFCIASICFLSRYCAGNLLLCIWRLGMHIYGNWHL